MKVRVESDVQETCWNHVWALLLLLPSAQLSQKRRDVCKLFVVCDWSNIYFYLVILPFTYGWAYFGVIFCYLLSFLFSKGTNINVRTYQDFMAFCTCEPLKLHITFIDLWLLISCCLKRKIEHCLLHQKMLSSIISPNWKQ